MIFSTIFLLHLPPPLHGASVVGDLIRKSILINNLFQINYINLSTSKRITEIGKKGIGKLFTFLCLNLKVISSILFFRFDLCYVTISTTGIGFYKDLCVIFLLKISRKRIVYHLHNKGVAEKQNKIIDNYLYRFAFKNVKVILLGKELYPDIQKYVEEKNVFYCPNGIPDGVNCINKAYVNKTVPRILFLSNIIENKGVFILLEACKILKEKGVSFKCDFVGDWGDIQEDHFYKRVESLGLKNQIIAHGGKYGHEKNFYFYKGDIFVFPTFYSNECFPLVLLEAMQAGLPVISTYEGAIPSFVDENITGYLVKQKDVYSLAEKIELLLRNPDLREKMGKAGQIRFNDNFTLRHFEERFVGIIKEIAAS